MTSWTDIDVDAVPREALPAVLGRLAELQARAWMRLHAEPAVVPATLRQTTLIDGDAAAAIAGVSRRWLLTATRGRPFRCDLSRKAARFSEDGLRRWLQGRGR